MSEKLRIGLYTSSLATSHAKPPGVDVFVDRLADQLVLRGHQVTMFTYSDPPPGRHYRLRRLSPPATATSRLRRMFVAPVRLNWIDTSGLDVMHLHGDDWFWVLRRVPTVRTFHGSALYEARSATRLRRRVSQYLTYALELGASRLATGSYGVIPERAPRYSIAGHLPLAYESPAMDPPVRSERPTVLFVGTWNGRKRGRLLSDCFTNEILARIPNAQLVMVSDYCEAGPNVTWVKRPSDDELAQLYRRAWVFCLPSSYEGFGQPYLEAMSHGTPVVATTNPGARFVMADDQFGILATETELGDRIADLLSDEDARLKLGRLGRLRAAEFGWEQAIDRHERAYRAAIAEFGRGRGGAGLSAGTPAGTRRG